MSYLYQAELLQLPQQRQIVLLQVNEIPRMTSILHDDKTERARNADYRTIL